MTAYCCDRAYLCGGEVECAIHGGFDVCCDRPDLHQEPADYFDYPQDYRRWKRGEPVMDAPLDETMTVAREQMAKWKTTLDWLEER